MKQNKQVDRVRERFERGLPITSLDGFSKLGIVHIPSVIRDLKKTGYPVRGEWVKGRNRFGEKVHFKVWRKAEIAVVSGTDNGLDGVYQHEKTVSLQEVSP